VVWLTAAIELLTIKNENMCFAFAITGDVKKNAIIKLYAENILRQ
jgi:hypothetical protein